jgi:predicted amidohydrolase YtcJ
VAQAIKISGNKIEAVGSDEDILKLKTETTEVVDLEGKAVAPGFIDAHQHMVMVGFTALCVNCTIQNVKSIEDILSEVRKAAQTTPKGEWIRGWGYNENNLAEGRHPERFDLDKAAPDHPVMLMRVCGHVSAANTLALSMIGIDDNTPNPKGGDIVHNENGQATGVLRETAHGLVMNGAMPEVDELIEGMRFVTDRLASEGLTTIHEAGAYGPTSLKALQKGSELGKLKQRVYAILFSFIDNVDFVNGFSASGLYSGFGNEKLSLGPAKLMIDGSSSAPTAAVSEPFVGRPDDRGILCYAQEEIDDVMLRAHKAGFQVTCHAIGDRAVDAVVTAIEKALEAAPREDHRHRVEHCMVVDDSLIKRIKKAGIIPIAQPGFFYDFGMGYLQNYGEDRVNRMFTCKTWFDEGIPVAGSSDCPVTVSAPLFGMYMAVNRMTKEGVPISQKERITAKQALRMYTYNGAFSSFEEDIKGSLEAGKLADLVILSESIYDVAPEKICDIEVLCTIVDGETVYEREGLCEK